MFDQLTGVEVDKAHAAAAYLLQIAKQTTIDTTLTVKLSTLQADLEAEQEDRRKIARSPIPISREDRS